MDSIMETPESWLLHKVDNGTQYGLYSIWSTEYIMLHLSFGRTRERESREVAVQKRLSLRCPSPSRAGSNAHALRSYWSQRSVLTCHLCPRPIVFTSCNILHSTILLCMYHVEPTISAGNRITIDKMIAIDWAWSFLLCTMSPKWQRSPQRQMTCPSESIDTIYYLVAGFAKSSISIRTDLAERQWAVNVNGKIIVTLVRPHVSSLLAFTT